MTIKRYFIMVLDLNYKKLSFTNANVVRHKSLYYDCHSCGSRNPEKHILDAASSAA